MEVLHNTEKYLTPAILELCYIPDKITTVDKQVGGNGFSYGSMNLEVPSGKVNIIIAPNTEVVAGKHRDYTDNRSRYINRIKFFYGASSDTSFEDADVLFFVEDSLWLRKEKLKEIAHKVDKVLKDEVHSAEQQSYNFRDNLVDFDTKIKNLFHYPETSIVKVTASPRLFAKSDIFIENALIKEQIIYKSSNRIDTVKRINVDLKNKVNLIVFTNSSATIYNLRNYKNEVRANFKVGSKLMQSLCELVTVINDPESNLIICSSRGFEGWDDEREGVKIYFFEDRSKPYESFYISNLYQAICRARLGGLYIEYCRQELSDQRYEPFKDIETEVNAFVSDTFKDKEGVILSVDNKQKTAYKKYKPFVIFNEDAAGVFTIKTNDVAIELYLETLIYDKGFPAPEFTDFINQRKLTFETLSDSPARFKTKLQPEHRINNLYKNRKFIEDNYFFSDDYTAPIFNHLIRHSKKKEDDYRMLYLKDLEVYLRHKNYNGAYVYSERERIALNILESTTKFKKLVKEITKAYDLRSIAKHDIKPSAPYRADFKIKGSCVVGMLIMMFTNKRVFAPKKWVAHRNYNLPTSVGMDELILIGNVFNMEVLEVDARNCYPRILYAICGKPFPDNFYGVNKERKKEINVFINNFFYDDTKATSKKHQKSNAKDKFKRLGFDPDVIEYLITNYFECKHRGALFSKVSFYEKQLISQIKKECNLVNEGIVRRHDSIILFNNKSDISYVNDLTFLGVGGWFKVKNIPVIPINEPDDLDEYREVGFDNEILKIVGNW